MAEKIPLFKIYWDESDVESVADAIKTGMNWAIGPKIEEFESLIAEYVGTKHCAVLNSGTSALHATLRAHGIKHGDEVIVPSFTFIATSNAPIFVGSKPVFADIEEETLGLDPDSVRKKITQKTKAIVPVHYGGCPCKIEELREIADENNLVIIEDAAEAFGSKVGQKSVGTFGDSAVLSFCANKVISTGEGGAVVTDDAALVKKLKLIRSHGRVEKSNYFGTGAGSDYVELGYNFRMSNITAALGISQIKKADKIIQMRRQNAEYILSKLKNIDWIKTQITRNFHVYQMLTLIIDNNRDGLMKHLSDEGIFSKVFFDPVHRTKFYTDIGYKESLPVTESISNKVLSVPLYPKMEREEMDRIVGAMESFR